MGSCHRYDPYADFSVSANAVEPYDEIYFYNHSADANQYLWDFGDGYISNEFSPAHFYDSEGTYTVSLTVRYNSGGSDVTYMDIDVYYTSLEVTVAEWNRNYSLNNRVPNAEVTIYATYDDWYYLKHPIETRYTDTYGIAYFPHVSPTLYYVDVYHAYYDNGALGEEDENYIRTGILDYTYTNTFTAWVDFVPASMQLRTKSARVPYKSASDRKAPENNFEVKKR